MAHGARFGYFTGPSVGGEVDSRFDVVGLGNAIVDALVRVPDDEVLESFGLVRGGISPVDDSEWQAVYAAVKHHGVEIASGGSCANTIATLGLLGANTRYCGRVGDDSMGSLYRESLQDACGGHALQTTDSHPTGKCLSIISALDAERTMLTDLGAAITMEGLGRFDEQIRDAKVLHLTGYLLLGEPMASRCMEAIAIAAQEEILISLDIADPFVVGIARDNILHIVEEFADLVFMNAEEARALLGCGPEEAAAQLAGDVDQVIVKMGASGSIVQQGRDVHHIDVHPTTAVDTTGAGDTYAGGYLYGLTQGWSPAECGDLGSRVASLTVGQVGGVCRDRDALATAVAATEA